MAHRIVPIPLLICTLLILVALAGCQKGLSARPDYEPVEMDPNLPTESYDVAFGDFKDLMPKLVEDQHWGIMRNQQDDNTLRILALTDADLQVDIRATRTDDGKTKVQITVGLFGNEKLEKQFHTALAKRIREKAAEKK